MHENKKKQRWYLDAGLVAIIIILIVLIAMTLKSPAEEQTVEQDAGNTLGGYPDSTSQTLLAMEETEEVQTEPALDFELQVLTGEMVSLSDFRGKPVLINFWATWCPPCIQEMPLLQEIADVYEEELVVLAINGGDSMEQIRAFAEAFEYTLIFLADPENTLSLEYSVRGFPTSFFIDAEGLIQGTYIGMMDENIIAYYLEKIGVVQ